MEITKNKLISINRSDIVDGRLIVPKGTTHIGDWAFEGCTGLTSITLPDSLTHIGSGAFRGCTGLTSITLPDSLTHIGDWAFEGCTGLTSITLPDSLTHIGSGAFRGCTGLTSITLRNTELKVKLIDGDLFVITSEKTSKGIKIYTGYIFHNITRSEVRKTECFVAEKEGYFAHGDSVKKAITDVQFKIVAEKLKNEPILPDTVITDNYYRLITGACELGVKAWREQNGITEETILAKDLLPLLKKTNAYGGRKFEELLSKNM